MNRKRLAVIAVVVGLSLLGAACGADETDPIDAGAAPSVPTTSPPITAPEGQGVQVTLYFTNGERLVPTTRTVPESGDLEAAAADALRALLAGPTAAESAAGMGTAIPSGTRLLGLDVGDDRIANVDLSGEFETGGGTASVRARLGQVACTMDNVVEFDIADGTRFLLDGRPVKVFSGEGIVLDKPVTCADYMSGSGAGAPTQGKPSASCRNGWVRPDVGTEERKQALDLLRISTGLTGKFVVTDMRYFTAKNVEYWYVKAVAENDPSFKGRFIVMKQDVGGGVIGVAGYDTTGFRAKTWAGFEGEGERRSYPDLPGRWGGVRYDFVTGEGGPGTPGLPADLQGCVADT